MACCQNNCKSKCVECQQMNGRGPPTAEDDEDEPDVQIIQRVTHKVHRCKRSLNCGHQCSTDCSAAHVESGCNIPCKEPCRQRCVHSKCTLKCSNPCAPCKERCTWYVMPLLFEDLWLINLRACPHFECPVPCGSVRGNSFISVFSFIEGLCLPGLCSFTMQQAVPQTTEMRTPLPIWLVLTPILNITTSWCDCDT